MMIRQTLVIKSKLMQNRRLDIMNVHRILCDVEPKLVCGSIRHPGFDPAACHPHRECLRVVISSSAATKSRVILNHGGTT